mgnify:CR=1 FL=1
MKRLIYIYTLALLFSGVTAPAQTFEEFRQQYREGMQAQQEDFNRFKTAYIEEFNQFVAARDSAYARYLAQSFREFEGGKAEKDETPKPPSISPFGGKEQPAPNPVEIDTAVESPPAMPGFRAPVPVKESMGEYATRSIKVGFYGNLLYFNYDPNLRLPLYEAYNSANISKAWLAMSNTNYSELVNQLYNYKSRFNLNDYGYLMMAQKLANGICYQSEANARLLTWFLLSKSRYKVKVGHKNSRSVHLLVAANRTIYGTRFNINNEFYYALGEDPGAIYTYDKVYEGADRLVNLDIIHPLNLGKSNVKKNFTFTFQGQEYDIPVSYNLNAIAFYNDYPDAEYTTHFESNVSRNIKESLLLAFQPLLESRSQGDAINLILRFVQTAFEYKTDEEQFGRERYFFPEEVFHYRYSDCEDRSVLFTYLVRELLGLKVVVLDYPGHIATAVKTDDLQGEYVVFQDEHYIICDPTYVNAPAGVAQQQYANSRINLVALQDPFFKGVQDNAWQLAADLFNGYPGTNDKNVVMDSKGNIYLTGYIIDETTALDPFVAKISKRKKLLWLKRAYGRGNDMGYNVTLDADENLYVAGSFEHDLVFPDQTLQKTSNNEYFVARYTSEGQLAWTRKIQPEANARNAIFTTRINPDGSIGAGSIYQESALYDNNGLSIDEDGNLLLVGNTLAAAVTNATATFTTNTAAAEQLKSMSDELIQQRYHRSVAGLFSVLYFVNEQGRIVPGRAAQQALDKYNPQFKREAPVIYKNLVRLKFIKNESGIITIANQEGDRIDFDKMRIENNAKIRVNTAPNGDATINVLSGISVGKAFIRFKLNHMKLYHDTGDILFDYDDDHTQVVMNLQEDILY